MGKVKRQNLGAKILYGFAFCILLPVLLILWARLAPQDLPELPEWELISWLLITAGFLLLGFAMIALWTLGKGLPMNAFPPKNYVSSGMYSLFRHPIYVGACLIVFGVALLTQNKFGFWIIAPVFVASCIALVLGFEKQHIENSFGNKRHYTFFSLPQLDRKNISAGERIRFLIMTYSPWLILYELAIRWSDYGVSFDTRLSFETMPVLEDAEWIYASIYVVLFLIPFIVHDKKILREHALAGWWATGIGMMLLFALPFYCSQTLFHAEGLAGSLLNFERLKDSTFGAFPSFHVIWALLAGRTLAMHFANLKWPFYSYSLAVAVACYLTGMHAVLDILAGVLVFAIVIYRQRIYAFLQMVSEKLANSWHEWHIGNFRIISHSVYSGLCAFVGLLIGYFFMENAWYLVSIMVFSLLCAALWGQFIEGSAALLRPFGYYGCILGAIIGCVITSYALNISPINLLAIFALAAPFVQGIGRLRCLVQGCCHGKLAQGHSGISVLNERSRVCHISHLKGKPIHNTQLYSIATNAVTAFIVWKLWIIEMPAAVLVGVYLICNGLGRFVEESYRGEVQTSVRAGLRIYQWAALASVFLGAVFTCLPSSKLELVHTSIALNGWICAFIGGIFSAFLLSMDFPKSNRRFSRLSG